MSDDPLSLRLYRRLLTLYPAGFRDRYADALERAFHDELKESTGPAALVRLWLHLLADLALSVPGQFAGEIAQDARQTIRQWARRPLQPAFAILALAIGIGANTGVFSVVNALLLRSLPFRDPGRLASLDNFFPPHDSAKQFHDWRAQTSYLADAALWESRAANLGGAGEWRRIHAVQVSWNFFQLLGTQPVLGRAFMPGDDIDHPGWGSPGRNWVAVIGYGLWMDLFGGDPKALGATIRLDGNPLTVVGVAPPGFDYPEKAVLWKPAAYSPGNYGWNTIARLKPGINWEQARAPFLADTDRLWPNRNHPGDPAALTPLGDQLAGPARKGSLVLMACVALILVIACTNVANLLMARTSDRSAELSIRSALGASHARITQQLLTECFLMALAGAFAGLLVAYWTTAIAARLQPAPLASQAFTILDGRVLGFAIAVSLASGLLFGALPSLYAGRVHAFGTRSSSQTRGSQRIREILVAAQVMLTVVLVTASISVGRAFVHLMRTDRGYDRSGVITIGVALEGTTHEENGTPYFQEVLDRLRRLPGVRGASVTRSLPLAVTGFMGGSYGVDGRRASKNSMSIAVMPEYFQTMGARFVAGRDFTDAEFQQGGKVAVVNDVFAREFGQPAELVGRDLTIGREHWKIVGVVRSMDYITDGANGNEVFHPPDSWWGSAIVVKVVGKAESRVAMIRDTIQSVDRQVPLFNVKTMDQLMDEKFARPQFYRTAVECFAGFALLLAMIGIYGIVSYSVARRTHEMGVRMALGTTPGKLRASVLRQSLIPIALGAVPGVASAVLAGRVLESLVDGARPVDAVTYAAALIFIGAIAAAGIWGATRPIARLDIGDILRTE